MKPFIAFSLLFASALHATVFMWPGDNSIRLPRLTGNIQIENRQLLIDGAPFIMKGVCYEPVRLGETIPEGNMTLNPTDEDLLTIEQDFQMMQTAGINTIRLYTPITDARVLTLLSAYHLRTIVSIGLTTATAEELETLGNTIDLLKNEPSTLIWEVGNEWNLNHFYTHGVKPSAGISVHDLSNKECLHFIRTMAQFIRSRDTLHPISTDLCFPTLLGQADYHPFLIYDVFPDFVDLYGINFYNGLGFGSSFSKPDDTSALTLWKKTSDKPFYLGEFGADAWNSTTHSYDPRDQKIAISTLTTDLLENLSALDPKNILVGGCVFEWCDEWWKGNNGPLDVHGHEGIPLPREGPWPDHTHNGAWFGIVDIDRNPRPAYETFSQFFSRTKQSFFQEISQ